MEETAKGGRLGGPRPLGKAQALPPPVHGEPGRRPLGLPEGGWSRGWAAEFGRFARAQIAQRRCEVRPATSRYWEWALGHLLPYFAGWRLDEIDARAIDAYRARKAAEAEMRRRAIERGEPIRDRRGQALRPLSPASINKTIDVLQWLLTMAVEYGEIAKNPALGRRRRLRAPRRHPPYLDSAHQIEALMGAAAELDRDPRWLIDDRLAVIVTLLFAGLRAHELAALRWRDVDFPDWRIRIERSKSPAGERDITILPILRKHLLPYRGRRSHEQPEELVFRTRSGGIRTKDNLRLRVLKPALARADRLLEADGRPPLPEGLSPHSLRHTFASLLLATGEDPVSVMRQLGHVEPGFTLRIYGHLMSHHPGARARLAALVTGIEAAPRRPQRRRLLIAAR